MVVGILLRLECGAAPLCMDHASATVTDFCSWSEAWSVYAAAFSSFHPHLATRLFQYQQFLALKSRSFQAAAWLRYDSEFRLKLAPMGAGVSMSSTLNLGRRVLRQMAFPRPTQPAPHDLLGLRQHDSSLCLMPKTQID